MKLQHFYHMYADGNWAEPFNEHLTALTDSGLLDSLDFIGVGIVGTEPKRHEVKSRLPDRFQVVAESTSGWEQVTHTALLDHLSEPSKILYAHTKGAAHSHHLQPSWRREMTEGVVSHWRECVEFLNEYDAVGCRWRRDPWRHFSGNFWWATSEYLSSLAPISYDHRDNAESWIGQSSTGGTHVGIEIVDNKLYSKVRDFGRVLVWRKSSGAIPTIKKISPGDEFVGYPPIVGSKIIRHLMSNGATYFIKGDTIIVESVR